MRTLLTQPFTLFEVTKLRRSVAEQASSCGLTGSRLDDFVLAVHESVINAVQHAGGHGHLRVWTVDGVLSAETRDLGSGIPDDYVSGQDRPSELAFTGRGIYLIRRLCDNVTFRTGPSGTSVRLTMRLPRAPGPGAARAMKRIRVSAGGAPRFGRFTA
ncbi:ATP-binding protein [Nonomuraea sp. NN258]|uniref:ATP-binding protein n=1 Tax=Nonomuraea antri TaxID=2730852 RepID=UPI001569EB60|nr:ATP-binding protein [Nonomuraea antri]NRQ37445.1 ATP-binding protein [Nonomuraea antri]